MQKYREHFGYLAPNRMVIEVVKVLTDDLMPSYPKGQTFDPRLLLIPAFPRDAYTVALKGHELKLSKIPSVEKVAQWLSKRNRSILICCSGNYIGYWYNDDNSMYYLDISVLVWGRENALKLARQNKQLYIYHPFTNTPIPVESTIEDDAISDTDGLIHDTEENFDMPITHQTYLNQLWNSLMFAVWLPFITVLIVISIMFSCMGILFVAKLFGFVFQRLITTPW